MVSSPQGSLGQYNWRVEKFSVAADGSSYGAGFGFVEFGKGAERKDGCVFLECALPSAYDLTIYDNNWGEDAVSGIQPFCKRWVQYGVAIFIGNRVLVKSWQQVRRRLCIFCGFSC